MNKIIHNKEHIVAIDALRCLAILAVVIYHFSWFVHPLETTFLRKGYIGVDLFFLVSGFLASFTTQKISPGNYASLKYIIMRIIRIFPAYFIITISYLVAYIMMSLPLPSWGTIIKSFLFLPLNPSQGPAYGHPVVDVGWTLNYEFFFTNSLR